MKKIIFSAISIAICTCIMFFVLLLLNPYILSMENDIKNCNEIIENGEDVVAIFQGFNASTGINNVVINDVQYELNYDSAISDVEGTPIPCVLYEGGCKINTSIQSFIIERDNILRAETLFKRIFFISYIMITIIVTLIVFTSVPIKK